MHVSTIKQQYIRSDNRIRLKGGGRKSSIIKEVQEELAKFLNDLCCKGIKVHSALLVEKIIGCANATVFGRALRG
jgi:hypothetical protein